jgi:hypothetical protein
MQTLVKNCFKKEHLEALKDLVVLEAPNGITKTREQVIEYFKTFHPMDKYGNINELMEILEQESYDYMDEHDGELMNMYAHIAGEKMRYRSEQIKKQQYQQEVRKFRHEHPGIAPSSAEIAKMVPPEKWKSTLMAETLEEKDAELSNSKDLLKQMEEMKAEIARLKARKKPAKADSDPEDQ